MVTAQVLKLAKEHRTPFYVYDISKLRESLNSAKTAADSLGYHVHYAIKANAEAHVLNEMRSVGFGIDCVSGQEVQCALENGFTPDQLAFAGVGKTDWEIDLAIEKELFSLNVESIEELRIIEERARFLNKSVKVALRLNPDVSANTHRYITTGLEENKFGISEWQLPEVFQELERSKYVQLVGLHFHIGSQITDLEPFRNLCGRMRHFIGVFEARGFRLEHLNAGGGLGFDYNNPDKSNNPDFEQFFGLFKQLLPLASYQTLHFELGRSLVASCADLISKVIYVKSGRQTKFLILDAGMTELIRPALYQAYHNIENLTSKELIRERYDVVGPICESSDCFGKAISLPKSERGDIIAIRSTGAYGECMSSMYNLRTPNPAQFIE